MSNQKQIRRRVMAVSLRPGESVPPDAVIVDTYDTITAPELSWWEKLTAFGTGGFFSTIIALVWTVSPIDDAAQALLVSLVSGGILAPVAPFLMLLDEVLLWIVGIPLMTIAIANRLCKKKIEKKNAVVNGQYKVK